MVWSAIADKSAHIKNLLKLLYCLVFSSASVDCGIETKSTAAMMAVAETYLE